MIKNQIALIGLPCLSLSLNIPGFPKSNATVTTFFRYCLFDLKFTLKAHLVDIIDNDSIEGCDAAGDFYIAPCSPEGLSLLTIKQYCEEFEQNHPLGRFIDVDLNDHHGNSVSSGKSKMCFFCLERPAIECRREKAHEPEELRLFMFTKMAAYNDEQRESKIIKKLSSLALQALLTEISLTPKPGLVDKFCSRSHTDMNFQDFLVSTATISPWFEDLIRRGFTFHESDLTRALPVIRIIGLRMESAMFEATRQVNTQKGIIFLMGLSLFSCGILFRSRDQFDIEVFRSIIQGISKDLVSRELADLSKIRKSHGEEIYIKYGFGGARGEAESGFSHVFKLGLPQLDRFGDLHDEALIKCFLAIASANDDTNILYRSDQVVLHNFQKLCKVALENFNDQNYSAIIDFCKVKNISPGGSADLLAVTIFVWLMIKNDWTQ